MKQYIIAGLMIFSMEALADSDITVTVDSIENVAKSTVLEACGTAASKSGKWPLVVTLEHGGAKYTTLTSQDGKFCHLVARRTWKGEITASASTIDGSSKSETIYFRKN